VDYKDVSTLRRLMSDRGKIKARRVTGTCRQHQRDVAIAIKTARELALLPYALLPSADKAGRGGGGRDGRSGGGMRPSPPRPDVEDAAGDVSGDGDSADDAADSDGGAGRTSSGTDVNSAAGVEPTPSLSRSEEE